MKTILRDKSILTEKKNLEELLSISQFPCFIGCTDQNKTADLFATLTYAICPDTGIIQVVNLLPPEILYDQYHSEAVGKVWANHHKKFQVFIQQFKHDSILELGGSNGNLARDFLKANKKTQWCMVEPSPSIASSDRLTVIKDYFPSKLIPPIHFDTIVHSHVIEHFYDPIEFLVQIRNQMMLSPKSKHVFTMPDLYRYLKNKQVNCLNFEHTLLLTEAVVDYLLVTVGFKILKKQKYKGHSIFYATELAEPKHIHFPNKYRNYKGKFLNFLSSVKQVVQKFSDYHDEIPTYIFGAHIFTQFLIKNGLNEKRLIGILDNSKSKVGKRLYGSSLKVFEPETIKGLKKVKVLLHVGAYQQEIKKQLLSINSKVIIVEP